MTEHRCLAGRNCRDAEKVDDPETGRTTKLGATIAEQNGLCDACIASAQRAVDEMPETWLALHMAIGENTRRANQKVSISRAAPIGLNTDADALKIAIVEWMIAAAARIAEALNVEDPQPRNNTDTEHAHTLIACTRILAPHVKKLVTLEADDVTIWLPPAEAKYPGERLYVDEHGTRHVGVRVVSMIGAELALEIVTLRRKARQLLALTSPIEKMGLPCPYCDEYELVRTHRTINLVNGGTKEIDQIDCGACNLSWPYERYQQLCLIWVKEDEMEREKLQKQLDTEKARRELAEWLLAKREWQLSLGLDCTDVLASDFVSAILTTAEEPDDDAYLSDKDIATLVGVSDSTVRSWASRGRITRHTADDGTITFHAREVWEYAKSNAGRTATVRRLTNERKAVSA